MTGKLSVHAGNMSMGQPCQWVTYIISLFILLSLQLFSSVAYKAKNREDLIAGLDEFLNEVTVLPPGEWDPKIRIEPPKKVPSAEMRYYHVNCEQWT